MNQIHRRIRLASPCALTMVILCSSAFSAPPAKTYLLRQTYAPGTYYLVINVDTRQQKAADRQADSGRPAPEMNVQQIWVVKMIVGNPDEKGNKTVATTYERIQQTTNVGDVAVSEYDSKAPKDQTGMLEQCFGPLRKAKITILLDREDNVVSIEGLEGIWTDVKKTHPDAKPMIEMMEKNFNNESLKKMILFSRDFLPAEPVAVDESWSSEQTLPTLAGNVTVNMDMTFASVEEEAGRRQALIVFSGKTREPRGTKNAPANSRDANGTVDIQQKGMLRFDLTAERVSETNALQTMVITLPGVAEPEKKDAVASAPVKITTQSAIATKEYVNEIPSELTEPPTSAPATAK